MLGATRRERARDMAELAWHCAHPDSEIYSSCLNLVRKCIYWKLIADVLISYNK